MQVRSDPTSTTPIKLGLTNTEGLKLRKGEIVQAVVEKSTGDGLFQVSIKGTIVEAAAELMLTAGQSLILRCEGSVDGRQVLKIVKPDEEYLLRVATFLQEMGYKADDRLTALTAKLIQYGLPLTRENIDLMLNSTRWLGGFNSLNLETAAWAVAGKLKANPETLVALRSFLTQPAAVNQLLPLVLQSLSTSGQKSGEGTISNLESHSDLIPTANGLESSVTATRFNDSKTRNASFREAQRTNATLELLRIIDSLVKVRDTGDPETIKLDLQRHFESHREITKALLVIQELLTGYSDTAKPAGKEVLQLVQRTAEELLGQAAFNSVDRQTSNQQAGFYYLAIPLEVAGRDQLMELRIYKDERGNRRLSEMDEIRLAVSLATANLGFVVFHVTWQKDNTLIIQGVVDNPNSKAMIEKDISVLQQRLIENGYTVQFLGMKVKAETESLRPGFPMKEYGTPIPGIDITV